MNDDFKRGFQEGFKRELKKLGLFGSLHRLVKESSDLDQDYALNGASKQEGRIQKEIQRIGPMLRAMGFTEDQIRQQAIGSLQRGKQQQGYPKTNYFKNAENAQDEPVGQEDKAPVIPNKYMKERFNENLKNLENETLEDECIRVYKLFLASSYKEPQELMDDMKTYLQDILQKYASEDSLFSSFVAQVDVDSAEYRVLYFFNVMQVILEIATNDQVSRQQIAGVINQFRRPFREHIISYIRYMQEVNRTKIMNSVFRTHSDFNPAHNQRTSGGSLFSWMERVSAVAKEIASDVEENGKISSKSLDDLLTVKEQAINLIIQYSSFRDKERASASKKNGFRLKTKIDKETGEKILARNSEGQIVIGSGSYPFYPSFIEFYLRGTIKRAAGENETLVDKVLLISEATIPLGKEEERTDDEVFKRMRGIATKFYRNRQLFTKFTDMSGSFANREVPAFYDRILDAYEKGYSTHGELLEFATMFANRIATRKKDTSDVCIRDYNIDAIVPFIRRWTANYKFFIDCTKAQKQKGQIEAMRGQMTNATRFIKQASDITAGTRQGTYAKNRDIRKKKRNNN